MTYKHITVKPIAGAIGAEVFGPDLSKSLPPAVLDEIHRAHLDHLVIVFRDQILTPDSHKAFARNFGSAHINEFFPTVEGHPDIQLVAKNPEDTRNVGSVWHTDVSYVATPPLGSMLYALEVPKSGGDTMFASMYASYEALSDGMKELLGGLNAVHSATKSFGTNATGPKMRVPRGSVLSLPLRITIRRTSSSSASSRSSWKRASISKLMLLRFSRRLSVMTMRSL